MISFLIVLHKNLPNEPEYWRHIVLYSSDDGFESCRKITLYSDLLDYDEFIEFVKRLDCDVTTSEEFDKLYWRDDYSVKRYSYKRIDTLDEKTIDAIEKCKVCVTRWCYRGCKTYEYLSSRGE